MISLYLICNKKFIDKKCNCQKNNNNNKKTLYHKNPKHKTFLFFDEWMNILANIGKHVFIMSV